MKETDILDELIIRDVETMKVVSDERRLAILKAMREPTTVKVIAADLDIPASKLYYHVNLLEKHQLIRVVGINIDSGIVEKQYQATAKRFNIRNPILAGANLGPEHVTALIGSMLDETKDGFRRAYEARSAAEPTPPRHPFASKKAFRLTDEQLTAFHAKLVALIKETDALAEANQHLDGEPFELAVAFYQRQPW